ncbi:MAG: chromosome condensation regulator RCC1 [Actinomycetota bacterium]|nr:chromosome condensation regulator RCC1 [Actinomycetota bacterium]MDH4353182.1 chromosome condensation regulator RCC1 [Actinomycetota bacterium]MDH5279086.1 chromosome condensation regulator RCC1 [Actinomycetota bacterium]
MVEFSHRLALVLVLMVSASPLATGGTASATASSGTATDMSAGGQHACAITPSKRLKCWGDNTYGQLGIGGDLSDQLVPVRVPRLRGVRFVDVGDYVTCAIVAHGGLKCWGDNDVGQVGDGTTQDRHKPTPVIGLAHGVVAVSVGSYHVCAALTSGRVKCWGQNFYGEAGTGTSGTEYHTPKLVKNIQSATQVSAGDSYTCATVNSKAKCWGANYYGALGDRTVQPRDKPTQVYGLTSGVKQVIAGYRTTCAILVRGRLKCWGDNSDGAVGTGTSGNEYHRPVQVLGMTRGVTSVDTDADVTCAVKNARAKCWGANFSYQLGDGTTDPKDVPNQVSGLTRGVRQIKTGLFHGCALKNNGVVRCWGGNQAGEVGIGSLSPQVPIPKRVHL